MLPPPGPVPLKHTLKCCPSNVLNLLPLPVLSVNPLGAGVHFYGVVIQHSTAYRTGERGRVNGYALERLVDDGSPIKQCCPSYCTGVFTPLCLASAKQAIEPCFGCVLYFHLRPPPQTLPPCNSTKWASGHSHTNLVVYVVGFELKAINVACVLLSYCV